ncbi:S8 family peptidase [[Mycoplasma] collis]|uniref:S8 family peptidase n=1 Tax=[Mycoplasma] collis TaxID=2127 RepID=UPI00051C11EA|nr:S8 family peptidase [[Mycoplasma] collis]
MNNKKNNVLQLKGVLFEQKKSEKKPGFLKLPKNAKVKVEHLKKLLKDLEQLFDFWQNQNLEINPLISVYYKKIVAKSNRIKSILESSLKKNNESIVGSKILNFKHVFIHSIKLKTLAESISNLKNVIDIILNVWKLDEINESHINGINKSNLLKKHFTKITSFIFVNIVVDAYYVEAFGLQEYNNDDKNNKDKAIVSIYDLKIDVIKLLKQLDISINFNQIANNTTLLLSEKDFFILKTKAPFLISMVFNDFNKLDDVRLSKKNIDNKKLSIIDPKNEPIIGVIDTMFDKNVYFGKWVQFENKLSPEIKLKNEDFIHGTLVSSIIVDGPNLNPNLEDGCGKFRVKHFGVSSQRGFSSFTIMKLIEEIIKANSEIKVWNLSLGSLYEISENFISPEAAILDQIQFENDVIFVISGTNKPANFDIKKIGSPADSLNSIVVNSVTFDNEPTNYTREGLVLSFFQKPDVSYYGGSFEKKIIAYGPQGKIEVMGTSFAAPWITRKLAFLIYVLDLPREVAKALIIDSAIGWGKEKYDNKKIGYGIVPIHINDIIQTPKDEIKFLIQDVSREYDSYNYKIPVPIFENKYPFKAKATMCYFPKASKNQGIDYTNTELDLYFGRMKLNETNKPTIVSINKNKQTHDDGFLFEKNARLQFRKWDNVKHIREIITKKNFAKKMFEFPSWGISVKTKERLNPNDGKKLPFGIVITLKELEGKNRIESFIQLCNLNGWTVSELNLEKRIDIFNKKNENIEFD